MAANDFLAVPSGDLIVGINIVFFGAIVPMVVDLVCPPSQLGVKLFSRVCQLQSRVSLECFVLHVMGTTDR